MGHICKGAYLNLQDGTILGSFLFTEDGQPAGSGWMFQSVVSALCQLDLVRQVGSACAGQLSQQVPWTLFPALLLLICCFLLLDQPLGLCKHRTHHPFLSVLDVFAWYKTHIVSSAVCSYQNHVTCACGRTTQHDSHCQDDRCSDTWGQGEDQQWHTHQP